MIENPERKQNDETMLKMKVFYTPDNSGDIAWVEKSVQDTALENHKKTLIDLIAMISGVPNITDLGFTNADNASALDRKFFALEQMITDADKHFKQAILRRWETIIDRINKRKHKSYDFRSIKIDLQRNLPTDKDTETARALKLRGLLSDASVIDMLPDDLDSNSELEKIDKQNEENIQKNLENMSKFGQENNNGKVGDTNGDMEVSRPTNANTKENISENIYNIADNKTKKRINTYIEQWKEQKLLIGYFGVLANNIYRRTRVKNSEILELLIYSAYIEEQNKLEEQEKQIMYEDANYYYEEGQKEVNKKKKPSIIPMALFLALLDQPNYSRTNLETIY